MIKISSDWKQNPKIKGSGVIACIPQTGLCPNKCEDCFFQSGRSYLEPLEENLPYIPSLVDSHGRIVRMNDGNDSNVDRRNVIAVAKRYDNYFFNTAIPKDLAGFHAPVVLTVNPGEKTDRNFHKLEEIPDNLMFVRVRVNSWNVSDVVIPAVDYYTGRGVAVVLTYMAYYKASPNPQYLRDYEWKKRTINSYWVLRDGRRMEICTFCGNCIREYYNTKERICGNSVRSEVK
jgi:hypothetical protein